jgi:ubiquinone/menaquinone biosynthesis C-methylase UbiE
MQHPEHARQELANTYFVQDRSNQEEMARLQILDQMITAGMGGVLPEQPDPTIFHRVLDVGCGTGGWLIEAAQTYPGMSLLAGADISGKMIAYARAQAADRQLSDRIEFHVMDALRMLEFPPDFFDLVNQRFGFSYLRTWDWPKLLQEYQRVTRSGGVIRITESEVVACNSPAQMRLYDLFLEALYRAGHLFVRERNGITSYLAHLMQQHGVQQVQTQVYTLEYRAGTPEGQLFAENMRLSYRTIVPWLRRWTRLPEDYQAIYQQAQLEMQQPDFVATWKLLTAWGTNL